MTAKRDCAANAILVTALDLPESDRKSFIGQECANDTYLLEEVESLLAAADQLPEGFLMTPLVLSPSAGLTEDSGPAKFDDQDSDVGEANASASYQVKPGRRLGQYEVLEQIGSGGMGEVFLAEDTKLRRKVAIKVLPPEVANDPAQRARLESEARALAALDHRNVLAAYALEEAKGVLFLVMERAEGRPLKDVIEKDGLALHRFFELALQLLDGLAAAHHKGITHGDVKPTNIMIGDDDRVRILDFGLALISPVAAEDSAEGTTVALAAEGMALGTVPYMAPEQFRGRAADTRSDVFSVGVTLYEMLTGCRPFAGTNSVGVASAILRDEPASLPSLRADIPPQLSRVVEQCLAKNPERRYRNADELRDEIVSAQEEQRRAAAALQRGRRRQKVGLVLFVILAIFSASMATLWRRSELALEISRAETLRARASKHLAIAQRELVRDPTAALARVSKSLELNDTDEARVLAVELIAAAPHYQLLPLDTSDQEMFYVIETSSDGHWLAVSGNGAVRIFDDSGAFQIAVRHAESSANLAFAPDGRHLVTYNAHPFGKGVVQVWSVPEGELVQTLAAKPGPTFVRGNRILRFALQTNLAEGEQPIFVIKAWPVTGGDEETIGRWNAEPANRVIRADVFGDTREGYGPTFGHDHFGAANWDLARSGDWLVFIRGSDVYRLAISGSGGGSGGQGVLLGRHDRDLVDIRISPDGGRLFLRDEDDGFHIWSLRAGTVVPERTLEKAMLDGLFQPKFDSTGRWLTWGAQGRRTTFLWDLEAPPGVVPAELKFERQTLRGGAFARDKWLATVHDDTVAFWNYQSSWPRRFQAVAQIMGPAGITITADGDHLASCHLDGLRILPLSPGHGRWRAVEKFDTWCTSVVASPTRSEIAFSMGPPIHGLHTLSLEDLEPREILTALPDQLFGGVGYSPDGERIGMGVLGADDPADNLIHILSAEGNKLHQFQYSDQSLRRATWDRGTQNPRLLPNGDVLVDGIGGVVRWNLETGNSTGLVESYQAEIEVSADGGQLLVLTAKALDGARNSDTAVLLFDLNSGSKTEILTHGCSVQDVVFDREGHLVATASLDRAVRVGRLTGEEPHLLLGLSGPAVAVAIAPEGEWIFAGGSEELLMWPMPDLTTDPLHKLPLDQLLQRLQSWSNLRLIEDAETSGGSRLEIGAVALTQPD